MSASWSSRGTVLVTLGRHHFAFFRGYLDGVELSRLYERYIDPGMKTLAGESSLKSARTLLAWIVEQLVVAARRYGHAPAARILRMRPEKLGATATSAVPDLAQFQEDRDPHQMYSEQELLNLFHEEYGAACSVADRRTRRNRRLRAKQATLLNQLEMQIARDPHLDDDVSGWLDPAISRRLHDVGICTLKQLVELIESHGFRWYTKVPRVGIKAAQYVVDWLMLPSNAGGLGIALSARSTSKRKHIDAATLPAPTPATDIVPIERFAVPAALNGIAGTNRGKASVLDARTDREAIMAWLARSRPGSSTARSYRKEAERLLLWAVLEVEKPLSSLTPQDCANYRYFLAHLGRQSEADWSGRFRLPQAKWLGPRGIDRFSTRWRPFEGALSVASQEAACLILQGMMAWMCDKGYLCSNTFKESGTNMRRKAPRSESAGLTESDWKLALAFMEAMERDSRYHRLRFILLTIYHTGCSVAELAEFRAKDIVEPTYSQGSIKMLQWRIEGNSRARRFATLHEKMLVEMDSYFMHGGYDALTEIAPDTPLISAFTEPGQAPRSGAQLSPNRIYAIIKRFFAQVADSIESTRPELAHTFRKASPKSIKRLADNARNDRVQSIA